MHFTFGDTIFPQLNPRICVTGNKVRLFAVGVVMVMVRSFAVMDSD